jgi:integrase
MATVHLTDRLVRALEPPATGNRITYDAAVKGFGVRVTANGARSYVLTYSTHAGRQRRITLGSFPDWNTTQARERAKELKRAVDAGGDPLADIEAEREAPDMGVLIERVRSEHFPRLRASSAVEYDRMIRNYVLKPKGHFAENTKVADITYDDIDALHRSITRRGYKHRANRCIALLSKMFALSIRWKMRADNPCKGVERHTEHARRRYIKPDELARLVEALAKFPDRDIADAIRLLLLTGARKNEVCSMKWADLDLGAGTWSKPPGSTKQNEAHTVPLSAPARQLLAERLSKRVDGESFVFPGRGSTRRIINIWHAWIRLCKTADIKGLRLHDLRHSYASALVSAGTVCR